MNSNRALSQMFDELDNRWDVKFYKAKLTYNFPKVLLGTFIDERSEKVKLSNYPDSTFEILQVSNQTGVSYSYSKLGQDFNQPYKKVYTGDLVYNPYRVNVGSIGVVSASCNGMYVSPAYVVFKTDQFKLAPEFLYHILKSSWYNPVIRASTAGSVRQNLTYELLKNLEVPSIPLIKQKEILEEIQKGVSKINKANALKEKLLKKIDLKFFESLGLKPTIEQLLPKSMATEWNSLNRWGVRYNQNKSLGLDITTGKYQVKKLSDVVNFIQYGSSEKANTDNSGIPILRMNNIKKRFIDTTNLKHIELSESQEAALLLEKGDLLIIRTNGSRSLVGTCAVFTEDTKYVFASYLIRLKVNLEVANPHFISWYLNSKLGREQIEMVSRQIMQNNINSPEILGLEVPVPPVKIQDFIMAKVGRQYNRNTLLDKYILKVNEELENYLESQIVLP